MDPVEPDQTQKQQSIIMKNMDEEEIEELDWTMDPQFDPGEENSIEEMKRNCAWYRYIDCAYAY